MSDYLVDGAAVDHDGFVARALDPAASCVVEACAGSGKTWLLVGRMVRLLLAGVAPGQILAITFTRRAAQEMRQRLFVDLAALARATDEEIVVMLRARGMSSSAAERAIPMAQGLYENVATAETTVAIETFHGWFWKLVQSAPLQVGVGYAPTLLERTEAMLDEAWTQFCRALLRPEAAASMRAYERLTTMIGDDAAEQLLRNFVRHRADWWCFADSAPSAVERACEPMRARLVALVGRDDRHPGAILRAEGMPKVLQDVLESWRAVRAPGKILGAAVDGLQHWLLAAADDADQELARLGEVFLTQEGKPRVALEPDAIEKKLAHAPALQPTYRAAHGKVLASLQAALAAREEWDALELTVHGLQCGQMLLSVFQQRKQRAAAVDFTDLEWHAHRLLRDPDIAAYMQSWLDARYRHLLLDEFQDTSPLQWQVLQSWLASYEGDSQRPKVFLVGDPKQSIYRFRGAEPRVFDVAREQLARDFGAVSLRTNVTRRNAPELVAVFNRVFADANPLYQAQSTRAPASAPGARFVLLPRVARSDDAVAERAPDTLRDVLSDARAERVRDERYREGLQLAASIATCLPGMVVEDGGAQRAARWSDVAILVRRRTYLAELERALRDAAVPFLGARRGSLLRQLEIEDLLALMEFLCNCHDDLQLARALRTPVFACDETDLMQLARAAGGSWWTRMQLLEPAGAVLARARSLLAAWLPRVGILPVHDLLDTVIFESEARARYAAAAPASASAQVQANIDALLELALTLDSGRFPSPMRFLEELRALRDADDSDADEGLAVDENAVRLLTIHAAKGLEAQIVVMPDTHFGDWQEDRNDVLLGWLPHQAAPEHFSLVARVSQLGTSRKRWVDLDREQRAQEDWNLLYVAMTRAKQMLIVSGVEGGRAAPGSWYERIASRLSHSMPASVRSASGARASQAAIESAAVPAGDGIRPGAPVSSAEPMRCFRDFRPPPILTGIRVDENQTESMRLGSAWHALLQRLGTEATTPWTVERVARSFSLSAELAAQAIAAARRVRSAPGLRRFFDAEVRADNELELVDHNGATVRIDRLVECDDVCWILDYKWQLAPETIAAHRRQVRRYGQVLMHAGVKKPVRLLLIAADASAIEVMAGSEADGDATAGDDGVLG